MIGPGDDRPWCPCASTSVGALRQGRRPGGGRLLACSTGDLTLVKLRDAIRRVQLGTLASLPQVSGRLREPGQAGRRRTTLALAITSPLTGGGGQSRTRR